ncbi:ComEC/Rec2 family competence protein [Kineosporia sp. NBRC 101731]|uniref:ComEC/Rec2 family competence protein n=1 Tax=Kineosporia sp. NBRC 101731 TaxID=3032199 RepID=UPI0024A2EF84|nr:ComEC/Rec2 family competence protein [Kineosporia sp. NBRC 101731]GLY32942.1 membrane protein [Kineosporia sp. NBRC 101731]
MSRLREATRIWLGTGGARRTAPGEGVKAAPAKRRTPRPAPDLRLLPGAGVAWLLTWGVLVLPARTVLMLGGGLAGLLVAGLGGAAIHLRQASASRRSVRTGVGGVGSLWSHLDRVTARAVASADLRAGRRRGRRVADPLRGRRVADPLRGHGSRRSPVAASRRAPGRYRARTPLTTWAAGLLLVLALAAPVMALTGLRLLHREQDPLSAVAGRGMTITFEGKVSGDPKRLSATSFGGEPLYLVRMGISRVEARQHAVASSARLVVFGTGGWGDLVAGQEVRASGRVRPADPGQPEAAVTFARGGPVVTHPGSWPWRFAEYLREGLREACSGLPDDARGLLPALVVGDTSGLDPDLEADLQAGGLTHLTAVSGSNVAILGAVTFVLIGALGGGRRVQAAGTALVIAGFVVLARPEPSVLRAAVMGVLALAGALMARRRAGVPMLAATVVLLLGVDPWLARSFGFALSVLATAGLLLLVPAWLYRLRRWPKAPVLALGVPVAAQVVTAPVTVLLDPVVSLVSVPANLLVDAAVAPATIAGVVAAALSPVWPFGASAVAWVGGLATQWIAVVAHRAAVVPAGSLPWPDGLAGATLLAALSLLGISLLMRGAWRTAVLLPLVLGVCLVLPRWIPVLPGSGPPADWTVVQCDVGQGSATAIRSGPDRAVLVDAGPDPDRADRCLRRIGVHHLDLVLVTHFHADHAEGLEGALDGRGSPPVYVSPVALPPVPARDVTRLAPGGRTIPVTTQVTGTAGTGAWQVRWRLLPPPVSAVRAGLAAASEPEGDKINNVSVVMLAEVRGLRVAALGDAEPEAQRALLRTLAAGPDAVPGTVSGTVPGAVSGTVPGAVPGRMVGDDGADVVVLSHHGSANQEERLYRFLHPRVVLIGVGADNDYGHPAPKALAMLRRIGAVAFRTDTQGQIAVTGGPGDLRVVTAG